eukprot:1189617-Prorocentrum_minimum.AAC.1
MRDEVKDRAIQKAKVCTYVRRVGGPKGFDTRTSPTSRMATNVLGVQTRAPPLLLHRLNGLRSALVA